MKRLTAWIDFDSRGLQSGYAKNRFGIVISEDDCGTDDVAHEFKITCCNVQLHFRTVGEFVRPLGLRGKSDLFEILSRNKRIPCSGINQEKAFPCLIQTGGIAHQNGHVCHAHVNNLL
jgi:hypothetical protein